MKTRSHTFGIALIGVCLTLPVASFAQTTPTPSRATEKKDEEAQVLNPFEVTSSRDKGYGSTHAMGASRINAALENEPVTVVTVNQQMLQDLGALYPPDALQFVSGVNTGNEYYSGAVTVRGFSLNTFDFRDGLPDQTGDSGGDFQFMGNVDRIEVVKGPTGVEFGATSLGGIINMISKKPLGYRRGSLKLYAASFDTYGASVDYNDGATANGRLRYRVIAEYGSGHTEYGGKIRKTVINPVVTYRVGEGTEFWARFNYGKYVLSRSTSLIADNAGKISFFLPRKSLKDLHEPLGTHVWVYKYELGYRTAFEAFDSRWNMRMVARLNHWDFNNPTSYFTTAWLVNAAGVRFTNTDRPDGLFSNPNWTTISIDRFIRTELRDQDYSNFNVDLTTDRKIGPANNTFVTYLYANSHREDQNRLTYTMPPLDIKNRVFYDDPFSVARFQSVGFNRRSTDTGFAWGTQDNLRLLNERLVLVGGARWDWGWQDVADLTRNPRTSTGGTAQAWTFKAGVVGKPVRGLAMFYNRSETFAPQIGILQGTTQALKNLEGVSDEIGLKSEFFNGNLIGTISYFDMTLNGFVYQPPGFDANGRPFPANQFGVTSTKGWEADIAFQPTRSVAMTLAYGDLTSLDDKGKAQRGVSQGPNYKGLVKYSFISGPAKGLAVGAGHVFVNSRAAVNGDLFRLPAYNTTSAFVSYTRQNWRLQFNVANLFDHDYAVGASSRTNQVERSLARNYLMTFEYTFK